MTPPTHTRPTNIPPIQKAGLVGKQIHMQQRKPTAAICTSQFNLFFIDAYGEANITSYLRSTKSVKWGNHREESGELLRKKQIIQGHFLLLSSTALFILNKYHLLLLQFLKSIYKQSLGGKDSYRRKWECYKP